MQDTIEEALTDLFATAVAADMWDITPELGYVISTPEGIELVHMGIHDHHWTVLRPVELIELVALNGANPDAPTIKMLEGCAMIGVLLLNEGWGVAVDTNDKAKEAEVSEQAKAHTLHERADRVEVRLLSVVTVEGMRYGMQHFRGKDEPGELITDDSRTGAILDGAIYEALDKLLTTLVAKTEYVTEQEMLLG